MGKSGAQILEERYRFERLMRELEIEEAYKIFEQEPQIILKIPLTNLIDYYCHIREKLGEDAANKLRDRARECLDSFDEHFELHMKIISHRDPEFNTPEMRKLERMSWASLYEKIHARAKASVESEA